MSDFTDTFWSVYVSVITLVGIAACLLLLWLTAKTRVAPGHDPADPSTGHVWDGDLCEMNNPLPRWWVGLFVLSTLAGLGYLLLYPGLGSYGGRLAWTSAGEHRSDVAQGQRDTAALYARFAGLSPEALAADAQAMAMGERLFMNHCAPCHGSDARGNKGFPNLSDKDWLHGGSPEQIRTSITQGRVGTMPVMAAAVGSPEDVKNLAHYVLSLSGSPHDSLRAALGKPKFAVCASCHGAGGKGNTALGAPNLSDDIWLHGYGEAAIIAMVNGGKTNVMPAQAGVLSEAQIQVLSAYVWQLSKPQAARP